MKNNIPDSIEVRLGQRIKDRRQKLDIDIIELSKESKIPLNRIVEFEGGIGTLEVAEIQQLSTALGMPITVLLEDSPKKQESLKLVSPKDGLALNYAFLRIESEQIRSEVIALVQALSSESNRLSSQRLVELRDKLATFSQSLSD